MTKYIFVTGGVVSGLGKGITAASLGRLLKARGLKVAAQKLDPYPPRPAGTPPLYPYRNTPQYYETRQGGERLYKYSIFSNTNQKSLRYYS